MNKDGFNNPFEILAGLKADKEPDIDLNFAEDIQEDIFRYLGEYFGEENVFRAGVISTVSDEMAAFRLLEYVEKTGELSGMGPVEDKRREEAIRKVSGTKRGMGMHPGGVIVVPKGADISEITPLQYLKKYTVSHLGYHAFDDCVAKYDILGHYALSELHELEKRTGVRQSEIPFSDEKVLSLFQNARALGLKDRMPNGLSRFGTLGVNGFDSQFAWGLLATLEVECFSDLMRISALSHGTGCWFENADELSEKGKALRELISYRDDIMLFLESRGMDHDNAFKIMECVRKGRYQRRGITDGIDLMQKLGIPEWYIDSCKKILYLFPKAHTVSYVKMAWKLAYYKLYYPEEFYTVVLRHKRVPGEILKNRDSLDEQIRRMEEFRYELSFREREDLWTMYLIAEAGERGCDIRAVLADAE
jgi:DNA polymerase-3 subunit alpha (Gram-positive type)